MCRFAPIKECEIEMFGVITCGLRLVPLKGMVSSLILSDRTTTPLKDSLDTAALAKHNRYVCRTTAIHRACAQDCWNR
eukprot:38702-Eustigmatos_ZCMA.PRE.1